MIYLVANWKSHKTLEEALQFCTDVKLADPTLVRQVLCPPFPYLFEMAQKLRGLIKDIPLGVQDISPYPPGAYTGAVTVEMVVAQAKYAIVGHSERRRYFSETSQHVANKVTRLIEAGMTPIVCVDEPYLSEQAAALHEADFERLIIAYEPLNAIGTGTPDSPEHAGKITQNIKKIFGGATPVLYGGSVTADSIGGFLAEPSISGALVGGASLEADSWNALVASALAP